MPRPAVRKAASGAPGAPGFVAYYRVSTDQQGRSGLGLEAQKEAVARHIAGASGRLVVEFQEVESGKRNDRPQLAAALAACRARRATLIVAKLDRLARNARFLLSIAEGTGDGGVVFADLPQIPPGAMGKFFITLMAAVAELEAGLISQRTRAALAVVRQRKSWISRSGRLCTRLGNPSLQRGSAIGTERGHAAQSGHSAAHATDVLPYILAAQKAGATSLRQVAAALTARGIQPPSGGAQWHAQQVRRVLARAGPSAA